MKPKTEETTKNFTQRVVDYQGWVFSPDKELFSMLIEGLMINYNRYGYFARPCRDASGVKEMDKDILCPCVYCVPDQKEYGHCYCGLYLTKEFAEKCIQPQSIPERQLTDNG